MNDFLKFSLGYGDRHYCRKASNQKIRILGSLLGTDIGCSQDRFFTQWLEEGKYTRVGGNATTVDLEENDIIEIRDVLDEEEGPAFRMPKDQYVKMVQQWQQLCLKKPQEIILTWDGKEISVIGKD